MNTLNSKLTSLAAALLMNGMIMTAVGYLFELQAHPRMSAISFAHQIVSHKWLG